MKMVTVANDFGRIALLYGSVTLFLTLLHNVFLLYYVDMFISIYKIDKASFWIGEVIFLLWNSINDPLFGMLSDHGILFGNQIKKNNDIVINRLLNLKRNAPLFSISFLLFWFLWLPPALQFTVCLCLYDGFLTCVDLQHTALLADLAIEAKDRAQLNRCCSIFGALGSTSVFVSYLFWNKAIVLPFQVFCSIIAVFSTIGFMFSIHFLLRLYMEKRKQVIDDKFTKHSVINENQNKVSLFSNKLGMKQYLSQLSSSKNFRWFILMNLVQVFHCHFNSNFFPLFLDSLLGDLVSPTVCSLLIGLSFVLPHLNNLYFLGLCDRYGTYKVINWLFYTKLILAIVMMFVGSSNILILCLFIASNRVFTEGTCKLLNLVISDLVDEDFVKHKRNNQASAVFFGMSSLLSKPGQTLAPLLGTWLFAVYAGEDIFQNDVLKSSDNTQNQILGGKSMHRDACFSILITVPVTCAIIQILSWKKFTLHGHKLNQVKTLRMGLVADMI